MNHTPTVQKYTMLQAQINENVTSGWEFTILRTHLIFGLLLIQNIVNTVWHVLIQNVDKCKHFISGIHNDLQKQKYSTHFPPLQQIW